MGYNLPMSPVDQIRREPQPTPAPPPKISPEEWRRAQFGFATCVYTTSEWGRDFARPIERYDRPLPSTVGQREILRDRLMASRAVAVADGQAISRFIDWWSWLGLAVVAGIVGVGASL